MSESGHSRPDCPRSAYRARPLRLERDRSWAKFETLVASNRIPDIVEWAADWARGGGPTPERISAYEANPPTLQLSSHMPFTTTSRANRFSSNVASPWRAVRRGGRKSRHVAAPRTVLLAPCSSLFLFFGRFGRVQGNTTRWLRSISPTGSPSPLHAAVKLGRCRDAAQRLVRTPWARQRIRALAAALLRYGSLSGEQIAELAA